MKLSESKLWCVAAQLLVLAPSLVAAQGPDLGHPDYSYGCDLTVPDLMAPPGGASVQEELRGRHYRVSLPKNYDGRTPAPLIIAFHDFNVTASEFEKLSHLSDPKYNKDAIVMYPEATHDVSYNPFVNVRQLTEPRDAGYQMETLLQKLMMWASQTEY
jgi:poly(3-hydroxybutyrate) depolymerase